MQILHNQWIIYGNNNEELSTIREILHFLEFEFYRIFNLDSESLEICEIYRDYQPCSCPMLVTNKAILRIRLNMESVTYWAQLIYQLSHEMCHYYIRQFKINKDSEIKWLEETICEAVSFYMLFYASENWMKCSLSDSNPSYQDQFASYLESSINELSSNKSFIMECSTIEDLKEFNDDSYKNRAKRHYERNLLYKTIRKFSTKCNCLLHYTDYINQDYPSLLVDFNKWKQEDDNYLIEILSVFQPEILTDVPA